ncbi:MAG: MotA/TolQ/ExbB proton channel family protein [Bdellovibrionales bacterium]|nr:MotA/TolQ/ExbB proton channel family protein [Bdellovibrionales bacterium]
MVERFITLYLKRKPTQKSLAQPFEGMIRRGEVSAVREQANAISATNPIGRVVVAGANAALNLGGKDEIQGKIDEVLLEENEKLQKRTGFLTMIANVATLAGLLGTITGMIKSFAAVTNASPMEKATLLSNGISEAMNTTAYGLIVAIPALIAYSILTNRSEQLQEDLQQASLKAFNWLTFTFEPIAVKKSNRAESVGQEIGLNNEMSL